MYKLRYDELVFPPGLEIPEEKFKPVDLDAEGEHLAGFIVADDLSLKPDFVYIHGAKIGTKQRVLSFTVPLLEAGMSVLSFDHSGHGDSTGHDELSSLGKREREARSVIEQFATAGPIIVCGSSMGGYTAISMLKHFDVKTLVLLCPAVYDRAAHDVQFGPEFTKILCQPKSWERSDAVELLESFKGNLLVFMGNHDEVIPTDVLKLIDKHSPNTHKKEIVTIESCPHKIPTWLREHANVAREIGDKIVEFSM